MQKSSLMLSLAILGLASLASAQLEGDAIILNKLKITEQIKSKDFDPVTLKLADPSLPVWTHEGVTYGSSAADSKDKFMADPSKYIEKAKKERFTQNFIKAMSTIWCPQTDQVNPGGLKEYEVKGIKYEVCCEHCEASIADEDFDKAIIRLKERAAKTFQLTGETYIEPKLSAVEDAIPPSRPATAAATVIPEPSWLPKDAKPTWAAGIGLIFEGRCQECHHAGGAAPMPFTTYGEAMKYAKDIKSDVISRKMPIWLADPAIGSFTNSRLLSKREIDLISKWADDKFPQGDGDYVTKVDWKQEWKMGKFDHTKWALGPPDHVIQLPPHKLGKDVSDEVKEFEIVTNLEQERWIVASQVILANDIDTFSIDAGPLGMFAQGNLMNEYATSNCRLLKKGQTVMARVHYMKGKGYESEDKGARIGLVFFPAAPPGMPPGASPDVKIAPMANTSFAIPAGADNIEVKSRFEFPSNGRIYSVMPLMARRGKSVSIKAILPGGKEQMVVSVPHWDFDWKTRFELISPMVAPQGTVVEMTAKFDNSVLNKANPDPKEEVKAGAGEVAEGWLVYSLQ